MIPLDRTRLREMALTGTATPEEIREMAGRCSERIARSLEIQSHLEALHSLNPGDSVCWNKGNGDQASLRVVGIEGYFVKMQASPLHLPFESLLCVLQAAAHAPGFDIVRAGADPSLTEGEGA